MALKLQVTTEFGVMGEYWKITNIFFDSVEKKSIIRLALYKDKEARLNNVTPLLIERFIWRGDDFIFDPENMNESNPYVLAYGKIREAEYIPMLDEYGKRIYDEYEEPVLEQINSFFEAENC